MQIEQRQWTKEKGWEVISSVDFKKTPQLVFVFGGRAELEDAARFAELKSFYTDSAILLCSTAGEILGIKVSDHTLSVTAVAFATASIEFSQATITDTSESETLGAKLGRELKHEGISHAMIFSDGLRVNGTALVKGLTEALPKHIAVTGGLVGDGPDFKKTLVGINEPPREGNLVLIGFYGEGLRVGYGSLGGWDSFGLERTITKAKDNVLYELDGKPALNLYKEYLGEQAAGLPGTGLLFPLSLQIKTEHGREIEVVRTLLAVNEEDQSMTFAGDMPEGVTAKLMKANFERLIDGAGGAAKMSGVESNLSNAELAVLISCVGRKLVLKERIEEEVEAVQSVLGEQTVLAGFYSYGEISPSAPTEKQCQLHNQTMTITTFKEV